MLTATRSTLPNHARPEYRGTAIGWSRSVFDGRRIAFVDTETTGKPPASHMIKIAVIDESGHVLLDTLINPEVLIPAESSQIPGIHDADVANAPSWHDVHANYIQVMEGRQVVAYNKAFDRPARDASCRRYGLPLPGGVWRCAMLAYSYFIGEINSVHGDYRWHKLIAANEFLRVDSAGHRALADAVSCRAVLEAMSLFPF
jgi:DNA polymerase-3 subunit epsilon